MVLMLLLALGTGADPLLHETANLKLHDALRRHIDLLKSSWVLGDAGSALLDFKHAKFPEFEAIACAKLINYGIQKELDDLFGDDLGLPGLGGDSVHKFFFSDGFHCFLPIR